MPTQCATDPVCSPIICGHGVLGGYSMYSSLPEARDNAVASCVSIYGGMPSRICSTRPAKPRTKLGGATGQITYLAWRSQQTCDVNHHLKGCHVGVHMCTWVVYICCVSVVANTYVLYMCAHISRLLACMHVCTNTFVHIHLHGHMHMYVYVYMHVSMQTQVCAHYKSKPLNMHMCMVEWFDLSEQSCTGVYTCMRVYCGHMNIYMYMCMVLYMSMYMYAWIAISIIKMCISIKSNVPPYHKYISAHAQDHSIVCVFVRKRE